MLLAFTWWTWKKAIATATITESANRGRASIWIESLLLRSNHPLGRRDEYPRGLFAKFPIDDRLAVGRRVIACNRGHFWDDEAFFA
jgi:hypothetical protein